MTSFPDATYRFFAFGSSFVGNGPTEPDMFTTPVPTRAPRADDIATVNFPDYDTGVDADYSYQSDELRIAIKVVKDDEKKQTYYIADIWMRNLDSFRPAFAHGEFRTGAEEGDVFAKRENAILAVNGSFNQGLMLHAGERYQNAALQQKKRFGFKAAIEHMGGPQDTIKPHW